jgi:peptide methionine sulfoxide reductase MsrA
MFGWKRRGATPALVADQPEGSGWGTAEVCFDPLRVSYDDLLRTFWPIHNRTTRNRQGLDRGSQYRSCLIIALGLYPT